MTIQFAHVNIIAKDWQKLALFYQQVFSCIPLPDKRNLSGDWIDDLTGIKNASIQGIHLRLPGKSMPTLEIFTYSNNSAAYDSKPNNLGITHLAFHVDDVELIVSKILDHGGSLVGKIVKKQYDNLGLLTCAYTKDPEGNIVEVQNWEK